MGLELCTRNAYCNCWVLYCVVYRRTEADGSCIVWWEGVLKLLGLVLCGGKATEAVGSCASLQFKAA